MMEVVRHCRALGVLCTVDVNMRPQIAQSLGIGASRYRDAALAVAQRCARRQGQRRGPAPSRVLGRAAGCRPRAAAPRLQARGSDAGCRGRLGGQRGGSRSSSRPQSVAVVDTVGAGDCFFAGFIASLQHQGALATCATARRRGCPRASSAPCRRVRRHQHRAQRLPAADLGRGGGLAPGVAAREHRSRIKYHQCVRVPELRTRRSFFDSLTGRPDLLCLIGR